MITAIFSILPFLVCFFWLIIFLLRWRVNSDAQHVLTVFCGVCTILYLCHACFFMGEETLLSNLVWRVCSLSVYPLYFLYIMRLSFGRIPWPCLLLFLPAVCLPSCLLIWPTIEWDMLQKILFLCLALFTCFYGLRLLRKFEVNVHDFYADTDTRSSQPIRLMLIALTATSLLSAVFSGIGREYFAANVLIIIPSFLFSSMLFALLYIGDLYHFSAGQMVTDQQPLLEELPSAEVISEDDQAEFINRLHHLMHDEQIYLEHNIKISDVAVRAGTCRTYISNYLNQQLNTSFSDYINRQRIEYADRLLRDDPTLKNEYLAEVSGFASEQSFLRNYRKFMGHNPRN